MEAGMSQPSIRRHQAARGPSEVATATSNFDEIVSASNLAAGFQELARRAGQGRDKWGFTYRDYSASDMWRGCRELEEAIRSQRYEPGPCRPVPINKRPKLGQTRKEAGTRTLQLPTIADRILSYVLHRALTPILDRDFADRSYGFRQGKSQWQLLIQLERDIRRTGCFHLVQDDVRNAFPSIDVDYVATLLNYDPFSQDLLDLIARVLRGELTSDEQGLRQGDCFSPTALNVILNHIHDRWLNGWQHPPLWFRYADNFVYLAHSALEAQEIQNRVESRLNQSNLALKREDGPAVDLRTNSANALGFCLRWKDNNLALSLKENAWLELEYVLDDCLENRESGLSRLRGWISANALALYCLPGDNHLRRLKNLYEQRFNPIPLGQLRQWVSESGKRWKRLRKEYDRGTGAIVSCAPHTPSNATSESQGCPESHHQDACPF
ncbi:hypothetical protein AYO47_02090 [Planctomyces sp. SCGC AG-212-M04]|nr:hypothetical protein AYO47_02090 [Planctomyces sp. SCGC AG-212-M04]